MCEKQQQQQQLHIYAYITIHFRFVFMLTYEKLIRLYLVWLLKFLKFLLN